MARRRDSRRPFRDSSRILYNPLAFPGSINRQDYQRLSGSRFLAAVVVIQTRRKKRVLTEAMSLTSWMMLSATRRGMVPRIHQRLPNFVSCELKTDAIDTEDTTLLDSLSRPLLFTWSVSTLAMHARNTSNIPCLCRSNRQYHHRKRGTENRTQNQVSIISNSCRRRIETQSKAEAGGNQNEEDGWILAYLSPLADELRYCRIP